MIDWGVLAALAGVALAIVLPTIAAWIALWVRIGNVLYRIDQAEQKDLELRAEIKEQECELRAEIKELWRVHNIQNGRLIVQDQIIFALIKGMKLDVSDLKATHHPEHGAGQ